MKKPTLLVLAAGVGSRYGGFKQIDPIGPNGEIILDYSLFDAARAGFGDAVLVVRPELEEPMRAHFEQTLGRAIPLTFVYQRLDDLPPGFSLPPERKKPWGTAHAVRAARDHVPGPFGVVNADDFYGPDSYRTLHAALCPMPADEYCLVGFELARTLSPHGSVSRGICQVDAGGELVEVVERTKIEPDTRTHAKFLDGDGQWRPLPADSIASMNMWGFDASFFTLLESRFAAFLESSIHEMKSECYIPTIVDGLIRQGLKKCRVHPTGSQWFGMTYPEDRSQVAASIRQLTSAGAYPESLRG